jgi:outer membrane protein assembly factor BamB
MTGKEVWRAAIPDLGPKGKDGAGYSSVVVSRAAGIKQYVQLLGRGLVGIRAEDGKFLWGYNRVANDVANVATPVAHVNWVFASTGYQTGSAFLELTRAPSGDALRVNEVYFLDAKTFQNHHGGFVLVANKIYGGHGHGKGFPICVELTTGRVVWGGDVRNAGSGSAAVAYADGNLYFRYENGVVVLIRATPDGYQEKGTLTIPDVRNPSWSHPVIAGGRLYLREQDAVYAYDIRA